jgi:hypothetical protein
MAVDYPDWNSPSALSGPYQLLGTVTQPQGLVTFTVPVGTTAIGVVPNTGNGVTLSGSPSGQQMTPGGQAQPAGFTSWIPFNVRGDTAIRVTVLGPATALAVVYAYAAPPSPVAFLGRQGVYLLPGGVPNEQGLTGPANSWAVLNAVTWAALIKQTVVAPSANLHIFLHQAELQVQAVGGLRLVLYEVLSGKALLYLASSQVGQVAMDFGGIDLGLAAELGTISDGAPTGSVVVTYTQT